MNKIRSLIHLIISIVMIFSFTMPMYHLEGLMAVGNIYIHHFDASIYMPLYALCMALLGISILSLRQNNKIEYENIIKLIIYIAIVAIASNISSSVSMVMGEMTEHTTIKSQIGNGLLLLFGCAAVGFIALLDNFLSRTTEEKEKVEIAEDKQEV